MFNLAYIRILILVLIFGLASLISSDSNAETHMGGAGVTLDDRIDLGITNAGNLNFGAVIGVGTAVVLSTVPSGISSTLALIVLEPDTFSRGAFQITGEPTYLYNIMCAASGTLDGFGDAAGDDMAISYTCSSDGNGGSTTAGLLNGSGTDKLGVGGTITTVAGQLVGGYSGIYSVTVNYP